MASDAVTIDGPTLTLDEVERIALASAHANLSSAAEERIARSRELVERTASENLSTYGLNTGVGRFVDRHIEPGNISELQHRVLRSHAAGVGDPYPAPVIRAAMALRINTLALGYSGVRVELVRLLLEQLNRGVLPYVPARGSVGASGDLAPLAHLCLPTIGEGKASVMAAGKNGAPGVVEHGTPVSGNDALRAVGLEPIELASKEGLSLINGTQFMLAMGTLYGLRAQRLCQLADLTCALTVEALRGSQHSFLAKIHALRPHPGQIAAAHNMRHAMDGSTILESHRYCDRVQDAYALRCAPQVHGASRDALRYALSSFAIEARAVTDNPLVFVDDDEIISNGNFHGQPVAIGLDVSAIALAELANIAERRIERLVNPSLSGLPAFLTPDGGLNSGYMIAQYTAASLVSENKVLCHPASVDSIPTSAAQEDHVSMGNHAGLKLAQVLANAERVLAIELLCAAQGVEFLQPRRPGHGANAAYRAVRKRVPTLREDRIVSDEIELIAGAIADGSLLSEMRGELLWELH